MDFLFLACELAAAFAGFTAIVSVFQNQPANREHVLNVVRLRHMLELSLFTIAVALLPSLMEGVGLERGTFRVAGVLAFAAQAVFLGMQVRTGLAAETRTLPGYSPLYARFLLGVGTAVLLVFAAVPFVPVRAQGWYQVGVALLLFASGCQFFRASTSVLRLTAIPSAKDDNGE